jgi:MFS family permease
MAEATIQSTGETTLSTAERDRIYRWNFMFFLADFVLFSLAFNLVGSTTVIPDFVRKLTHSEILIAFSSQMFEIGWLMPQLLVARWLIRVENKKWWFIGPNIPVRMLMIVFAGIVVLVGPDHPGVLLACFMVFYGLMALGDGLVGVPWVDLMGSSLDNRRRARLFGLGNALIGVTVLGVAPVIRFVLGDNGPDFPNNYALLFLLAGIGFLITVPAGILIHELPGGKAQETMPSMREYLPDLLRVLREDRPFRAMTLARVLTTFFTMAGPFYIGFATERLDMESDVAVSNLLMMQTLGSVSAALLFARLGDRYLLWFIRLVMLAGVFQPVMALIASLTGPAPLYFAFLIGGVVGSTLFLCFINWLIAYATPDQRPIYSGLFNSVSAMGLLMAPLVGGLLVEILGYEAVFMVALVMMSSALFVVLRHSKTLVPGH